MEAPSASGLPKFKAGGKFEDEFTASRMNAIVDYIRSITPLRGVGTLVKRTAAGTTIDAIKKGAGGAASISDLAIYDASTTEDGVTTLKIGVKPGCVTCYRTTDGLQPWPDNFTLASGYKHEFEVTETGAVWVKVTNDISGATDKASAITLDNGSVVPDNTDTLGHQVLGRWTVTDGVIAIISGSKGVGNLAYYYCAGTSFFTGLPSGLL